MSQEEKENAPLDQQTEHQLQLINDAVKPQLMGLSANLNNIFSDNSIVIAITVIPKIQRIAVNIVNADPEMVEEILFTLLKSIEENKSVQHKAGHA